MVSDHYLEYSIHFILGVCADYASLQRWKYIWPSWPFFPSGGQQMAAIAVAFNHYLVYWSFNILHTGYCSFQEWLNVLATLAKFQSSGGQRWTKLVVYDNWPVSWHFLAMSTVGLCWISHYPNVHIYWETHTVYECISEMFYTWWKYTVSPFSYILL